MDLSVTLVLLIPLLPLSAFVVQIFYGSRLPRDGDWVSISAIGGSFLISLMIFTNLLGAYDPNWHEAFPYTWIDLETFNITMGIWIDSLTAVMLVIVTGVGGLIHLYSVGYMEGDPGKYRFFAYLSLFTFSMLGIVLTDNLFGLFIFWELVGLSSFFLIGFWYEKPEAANASKKAFLTTRVGDLGMFLGILMIVWKLAPLEQYTNPLAFQTIFDAAGTGAFGSEVLLTAIGIALFFGAVGKSAQLPLHVWLPDAMEGPTPVSALIHAATMVAAGVYMVARLTPFFTPGALLFIGYVGAMTAFVAASIALVKNDIKKGLAYSTVSQLGYMFLALGVGGYVAGTLHLTTHAVFKALLFMGSGSVIHAVHTQDMRDMGGLWKKMPVTFLTFLTATLAISGIPFFSGFYSKEKILASSLLYGVTTESNFFIPNLHMVPFILGLIAAGMTAFYMFRMVFMTFLGEPGDEERVSHAHESPKSMTIPMAILGVFCFAFFFQAGPPTATTGHGSDGHNGPEEQHASLNNTDIGLVQPASAASAESNEHGESKDHGGGHGGWFEALLTNPAPVKHYSAGTHAWAANLTGTLSILIAGAGILLAAFLYANIIWVGITGGVLAFLSFTINFWVWIPLLLLTGATYWAKQNLEFSMPESLRGLKKLLAAKYYFDELYRDSVVAGTLKAASLSAVVDNVIIDGIVNAQGLMLRFLSKLSGAIDTIFVDGAVNGIANLINRWGDRLRGLQSGEVQWYLNIIAFGLGTILLATVLFL